MTEIEARLTDLMAQFKDQNVIRRKDYRKFLLYSVITHSTAFAGSVMTEMDNQLLFDEGVLVNGRLQVDKLMNLDLKHAYDEMMKMAIKHRDLSFEMLWELASLVMRNTGTVYNTKSGPFNSNTGYFRRFNISADFGSRPYPTYQNLGAALDSFCTDINSARARIPASKVAESYKMSFDACLRLIDVYPWADGNGRMARLIMNYLQIERGLIPSFVDVRMKSEFFKAQVASRDSGNMEQFENFMMEQHSIYLQKTMEHYTRTKETDDGAVTEVRLTKRETAVMKQIKAGRNFTMTEIADRVGVLPHTVKRYLNHLQQMGMVEWVGSRKDGHWVAKI
jgi:Fic family protein